MPTEIRHEFVPAAGGVRLHVARAGEGAPVVLLHGFPENWSSWRHQIPALAQAGFSVWAPDLRGYNLSDRPATRSAYHLSNLVADVAALARASGHPRIHLGGHDWGGLIAWTFAGEYPDLLDRLVIFNAPHMDIFLNKVWRPPQMFRSAYLPFFQLPVAAEYVLSANRFWLVREMFKHTPVRKGAFSEQDIEDYVTALGRPGALHAALNYYRINLLPDALHLARRARSLSDTLIVWGEGDPALGLELLDGIERVAPRGRVHRIPDAGHWVQNEAPEEVNRVLLDFLARPGAPI